MPTVAAELGGTIKASGNVVAQSLSSTDADSTVNLDAGSTSAVSLSTDTITFTENHGFAAGDEVIYTAAGTPLDPLTNGHRYFVIYDANTPDIIKLAATYAEANGDPGDLEANPPVPPTPPTPIDLVPSTNNADRFVEHSLRKVSDQAIGGLADGRTYDIANSDTNAGTFKLATNAAGTNLVTLTTTDATSGTALTGSHTIGTEGIDLTGTGSGSHRLVLDLTSLGSGTQTLEGIGARALIGAPSGDGITTASAGGYRVGVVLRVAGARTTATSTPAVTTTIGSGASITGYDVQVDATSFSNASGVATDAGGRLVSVGDSRSTVTSTNCP